MSNVVGIKDKHQEEIDQIIDLLVHNSLGLTALVAITFQQDGSMTIHGAGPNEKIAIAAIRLNKLAQDMASS